MKTLFTIIILIVAIPLSVFMIRGCLDRSKSNKTSLFGSFNSEYRDDPLGKVTPAFLEGLEEAYKNKPPCKKMLRKENIPGAIIILLCVLLAIFSVYMFMLHWNIDGTSRHGKYEHAQAEKHFTEVGKLQGEEVYTYGIDGVTYRTVLANEISLKHYIRQDSLTKDRWLGGKKKSERNYYTLYSDEDIASLNYICYGDIVIVTAFHQDPEEAIAEYVKSGRKNSNVDIEFIPSVIYGEDLDFTLYYTFKGKTDKRVKRIKIADMDDMAGYNGSSVYSDNLDMNENGKKTRCVEWGIGFDTDDGCPEKDVTFSKARVMFNDRTWQDVYLGEITVLSEENGNYLDGNFSINNADENIVTTRFEAPVSGRLTLDEESEVLLDRIFSEWEMPKIRKG